MFNFEPIPEDQLTQKNDSWRNIEEGEVTFQVYSFEEMETGSIKINFLVTDDKRNRGKFSDFFSKNTQWKILNFLKSIGKANLYNKGELNFDNLISDKGRLVLKNKDYKGRNTLQIDSYLPYEGFIDPNVSLNDWDTDDEIPF